MKSESINLLAIALTLAQKEVGVIVKDTINPAFNGASAKYATLSTIWQKVLDVFPKYDLNVIQLPYPEVEEGYLGVETILSHQSGEWVSGVTKIFAGVERTDYKTNAKYSLFNAHSFGSAITYCRRYGISTVCGLITDIDDDGNKASGKDKEDKSVSVQASQEATGVLSDIKKVGNKFGLVVNGKTYVTFSDIVGSRAKKLKGKQITITYDSETIKGKKQLNCLGFVEGGK